MFVTKIRWLADEIAGMEKINIINLYDIDGDVRGNTYCWGGCKCRPLLFTVNS